MRKLTKGERRAVLDALMWVRGEYDASYAIETRPTPAETGALTRAIKKLGGDPHPSTPTTMTAAQVAGMLAGKRSASRHARPEEPHRPIGFELNQKEA